MAYRVARHGKTRREVNRTIGWIPLRTNQSGRIKNKKQHTHTHTEPLKGVTGEYAPLITMDECRFRYNNSTTSTSPSFILSTISDVTAPSWLLEDMTLNVSAVWKSYFNSGKSTLVRILCVEKLLNKGWNIV